MRLMLAVTFCTNTAVTQGRRASRLTAKKIPDFTAQMNSPRRFPLSDEDLLPSIDVAAGD